MILIYVEDDINHSELFARLLRMAAINLHVELEVKCTDELQKIADNLPCDGILLDLSLANGHTTSSIQWILENHETMPPIVVLSGYVDFMGISLKSGAADFINKDDATRDPVLFMERIIEAVSRHRRID